METAVTKYQTRARTIMTQCLPKSRIDRRRTRMDSVSRMCDTDEEEESVSEESGDEELRSSTSDDEEEQTPANKTTESSDEDNVIHRKRLRTSSSNIFIDSDSSSGSEIYSNPVRKIKGNSRRISIQDEEEDSGEEKTSVTNFDVKNGKVSQTEKELTIARKRKRQLELKRLSKKKRSHYTTSGSYELFEESDEESGPSLFKVESISDTEWENDSLKDFIVLDDKEPHVTTSGQPESSKSILAKHLPNLLNHDLYSHFRRVVKALLINAIDANFLKSLYEGSRKKKYAQEILKSLNHLDERCIRPRLVNLRTTSRWKNRYQERVDCYPNLRMKEHPGFKTSCQACELQRTCRFTVILSGQLYNGKSLEQDSFMSNDKQAMVVGRVCAQRTEVYHNLKHFKYSLYQQCCSFVQSDDTQDENVKDTVNRFYERLEEQTWIEEEFKHLEIFLSDADYFCEEKLLE